MTPASTSLAPRELLAVLASLVQPETGSGEAVDLRRLKGGYSREMWSFDLLTAGGRRPLILCVDSEAGVVGAGPHSLGRVHEAELLAALHGAGLPVPGVAAAADAGGPLGRPFLIMDRLPGSAAIGPLHRDPRYTQHRGRLASQLAGILARIHAAPVDDRIFGSRPPSYGLTATEQWTAELQGTPLGTATAFSEAIGWLEGHVPPPPPQPTLVHGDYRTGNILHDCDQSGMPNLLSVLDWEMAHLGDPLEDVAWAALVCWRVGTGRVGGLAELHEWPALYARAAGRPVESVALRFWEVLGSVKMACLMHRASVAVSDAAERSLLERLLAELEAETEILLALD
ncbi:phosphotransferase family protein [Acidiferrimicrobium sp. IK]|uniref:phosphotransferase family protein n=1 Tax=Acidiferrimicrobium sp. IK TaxID=2871700 RepID=UPI0021CAF857|nr:phosphotransferase family protein [Acidiferrimicrobium sp. IK]MCU4186645.1 phosphotransferase family protein [Acidiferrimicrobium sp. IK]